MKQKISVFMLMVSFIMFALPVVAGGKLSVQTNVYDNTVIRPSVGLGIYQKLLNKVAFNSWTGVGMQPLILKEDVTWFVTKNQLDFYMGKVAVSPGLELKYVWPYNEMRTNYFVTIDYRLW